MASLPRGSDSKPAGKRRGRPLSPSVRMNIRHAIFTGVQRVLISRG